MKDVHLRIRNLSNRDYMYLKNLALEKTGTTSITKLVRKTIFDQTFENTTFVDLTESKPSRLEIRLPAKNYIKLQEQAKDEGMTINSYIALVLHSYISKEPLMTTVEVNAIRESNYQLYKIGVNLNQIAKALNEIGVSTLEMSEINKLKQLMDSHIKKVHLLIDKNQERI